VRGCDRTLDEPASLLPPDPTRSRNTTSTARCNKSRQCVYDRVPDMWTYHLLRGNNRSVTVLSNIKRRHIPRMMVARPRAVPIPRPRIAFGPTRLNLGGTARERVSETERRQRHSYSHRRVLQHVRDDEESDHASTNVHLVQLRHTSIALCNCDLLERDVQVVLGYQGRAI
jgi:hypothetical protein